MHPVCAVCAHALLGASQENHTCQRTVLTTFLSQVVSHIIGNHSQLGVGGVEMLGLGRRGPARLHVGHRGGGGGEGLREEEGGRVRGNDQPSNWGGAGAGGGGCYVTWDAVQACGYK